MKAGKPESRALESHQEKHHTTNNTHRRRIIIHVEPTQSQQIHINIHNLILNMTSISENSNYQQDATNGFVDNKTIYMVKKIFYTFCNEQNYLGFKEFKKLDEATEESESQLTEETFGQLCHYLMVENPTQGLDINQFSLIYLNQSASEALGSDLNSDFGTLFPEEAKVALIFDVYDIDQDGCLNEKEFDEFAKSVKSKTIANTADNNDDLGKMRKGLYVALASILQYEVKIGLSLNNLIDLYLSDNEVMMNLRTGFNLDQLDKHAEEAAKKIGL